MSPNVKTKNHNMTTATNQCSRCDKLRAIFRDTGDFFCDACYQQLFPISAICNASNNKRPSILKQIISNKQDRYVSDSFPEEEECRLCLEQGLFRQCCKKYYCSHCYSKGEGCPGCDEPVISFDLRRGTRPR